ncbi:MAG: hypothetical protein MH472_12105 [Bacteroidia bacterium]|nr:hypothetical protein [Bacteroidia bacterium]
MDYLRLKSIQPQKAAQLLFAIISIALLGAALFGSTMGEGGDSTTHYLYSKLSWQNPSYFFNHWAKPFFTLCSSPFAQFGIKGIMVFNVLCSIAAAYFSNLISQKLGFKYYYLTAIVVITMPLLLPVTLSGLTEPFSALLLSLAVYLYLNQSVLISLIIASFLPFVRSEGLIIISVFACLLVIEKRWKYLPWLMFGHVVYSLVGWAYYADILWVFNKIPYATMNSVYGKGNWTHFINQLYFCIQPFSFVMFCVAVLYLPIEWYQKKSNYHFQKLFLIYGISLGFIAAHSAFWALGIFNSMGLNRVLVTIFPLIGVLAMQGLHALLEMQKNKPIYQERFVYFFMAGILVFPLLNNPASTNFNEAVNINKQHQFLRDELMPYLEEKHPNVNYFFGETEIGLFTGKDIFKEETWLYPGAAVPPYNMQSGDVLVFDSLLMLEERNISLDQLRAENNLIEEAHFPLVNNQKKATFYYLFIKP